MSEQRSECGFIVGSPRNLKSWVPGADHERARTAPLVAFREPNRFLDFRTGNDLVDDGLQSALLGVKVRGWGRVS